MIKWIAFITMVIDHIGMIFFPNIEVLRYIGRVSMPLYAYCLARGFTVSSEKGTLGKYFAKIAAFALASEIVYYFVMGHGMNIGITWLLALVFMVCSVHMRTEGFFVGLISLLGCFAVCAVISPMYGWYGMVLPYYFWSNMDKRDIATSPRGRFDLSWGIMTTEMILITFLYGNFDQFFAILALPILWLVLPLEKEIRFPNWLNYLAYPGHLLILGVIALLF